MGINSRTYTRRQVLRAVGAGAAAVSMSGAASSLLAACGGSSATDLSFGVEFTDAPSQKAVKDYVFKPFLDSHKNVKSISFDAFNGANDLDRGLKLQLESGKGPDLYDENGPSWMPPFASTNHAENLDGMAKKYRWKERLLPFAYTSTLYKGHLYSAPTEYEGLHLWYNATLFQKYGWSVPTDYESLVALCKEIQGHGLVPFAAGFSDCKACWEWWHTYAFNATLGNQGLYRVLTGDTPWTDPSCVDALTKLKALWDAGYIANKQADALSGDSSLALWGSQKAAMYLQGTWGFSTIDQYAKGWDYGVGRLPMWSSERPAIPIGIGEVDAINPGSRNLDAAEQLLNYITAPATDAEAGQIIKNIQSVWIPCIPLTADQLPDDMDPRFKTTLVTLQQAMSDGSAGYVAWSAWPSKTESYMWENLDSVLLGQMTIPAFLSGTDQQFRKEKSAGELPTVPKPAGV